MAITVHIPTPLRPFVGNQDELSIEKEGSIQEILEQLTHNNADLKKHLFNAEGEVRNFVNVYLNEEDIRYQKGAATPVKNGDVVSIVPSIAGGNHADAIVYAMRASYIFSFCIKSNISPSDSNAF